MWNLCCIDGTVYTRKNVVFWYFPVYNFCTVLFLFFFGVSYLGKMLMLLVNLPWTLSYERVGSIWKPSFHRCNYFYFTQSGKTVGGYRTVCLLDASIAVHSSAQQTGVWLDQLCLNGLPSLCQIYYGGMIPVTWCVPRPEYASRYIRLSRVVQKWRRKTSPFARPVGGKDASCGTRRSFSFQRTLFRLGKNNSHNSEWVGGFV